MISVLIALASTTPPSIAVAYLWYIRSVTSYNKAELERQHAVALNEAGARIDSTRELLMSQDKQLSVLHAQVANLQEYVQNQQKSIDILADR